MNIKANGKFRFKVAESSKNMELRENGVMIHSTSMKRMNNRNF
ncbi:hypothetical protein Cflav_PD0288 [Pedosphaera parvula Ellin514]|uniref:Uncharacterized protein n=1 Tax=Pedosphaera parvula (strain Ellin514) TaxID=320771 RepID=B9XSE2_PEDPL|nr:hypothetical protein Cflav_PD0288 [Pedosphaera parvula Ellin514]